MIWKTGRRNLIAAVITPVIVLFNTTSLNAQTCTNTPAPPSISGPTLAQCVPNYVFTLTNTSTLSTSWYQYSYGGNAISTNSVFVTPTITSSATYYVVQSQSLATGSISLPAYASTYNGNTRGMWFTAPTSFIITGVQVPTDVSSGNQSIAIMKFPSNPPTYSSVTNTFSILYLTQNNTNTGIIPVNIPIYNGDIIGVLGCRVNGTTYGTSYGSSGPFTASLGTNTLTLNRLGMQYTLATTSPLDIWTEAASIGRVELYTSIGCLSALTPVTVSVAAIPVFPISGPLSSICSGASTTLSVNGASSYTWTSNSSNASSIVVTPTVSTVYTVMSAISPTCASTSTFNVIVNNAAPVLSVSASNNSICLGGSVTLTGSGANTYSWSGGVSNGISFSPTTTAAYTLNAGNACGTSSIVSTVSVIPLPVAITGSSNIICSGSPIPLTASGATSYTWLPGSYVGTTYIVSPGSTTTYSVMGMTGSCFGYSLYTLTTNPLPTVSAVASNSQVCAGDAVVLTASGGLNYTWTPGNLSGTSVTVSPSTSTGYSVAGNNSFGCLAGVQIAVITNPSPTITIASSANMVCAGDLVTINASGATNYTWSAGGNTSSISVNPLTSSVYTVTGSSNNCSASQTVNVDVFIPVVSITGQTLICSGQTASLLASGANSYTWSNNIPFAGINVTPLVTTLYSVAAEATSLNVTCPGAASVLVTVNPNPTVTAVASRTSMCVNEKNTLTASGAGTYSWSSGQTSASFTIAPNLVTTFVYTVTGTDANNCSETATLTVKVNSCTGIDLLSKNGLAIYPNPNNGSFSVKSDAADMSFILMNELGQQVLKFELNQQNNYQVELKNITGGIYYLISSTPGAGAYKVIIE